MPGRRIALFLWSFSNDYQSLLRQDCEAAARRHGAQLRAFSAESDAEEQVRQIHQVLAEPAESRPEVILVCPVEDARLRPVAHAAAEAGVGWVVLNRVGDYLAELRPKHPRLPLFSVNPDQDQVGRIQAEQFKLLLPRGGELFYLQGPLFASSAERRRATMLRTLAGYAIKCLSFRCDWTEQSAAEATRHWIQMLGPGPGPECVVGAQNDDMALGARRALLEQASALGRPEIAQIRVTGCDGSPGFGQRLVREHVLAATVLIPPTAGRAVEEALSVLEGHKRSPSEVVLGVASFPTLEELALLHAGGRSRP